MSLSNADDALVAAIEDLIGAVVHLEGRTDLLSFTMADVARSATRVLEDARKHPEWYLEVKAERDEERRLHREWAEGVIGTGENPCDECTAGECNDCPAWKPENEPDIDGEGWEPPP